jgi:hypothetical protein
MHKPQSVSNIFSADGRPWFATFDHLQMAGAEIMTKTTKPFV